MGFPAHTVDPVGESLPTAQGTHADDPEDAWYVPAAQLVQSLALVAPVVEQYLPAAQSSQLVVPWPGANCPTAQLAQLAAWAAENLPAPHGKHDVALDDAAYCPAPQEAQVAVPVSAA